MTSHCPTFFLSLLIIFFLTGCALRQSAALTPDPSPEGRGGQAITPTPSLGAGFRFSTYGPESDPGPEYWASVGERMSAKFPGSHPEALWIVGSFFGDGKTYLSFPAETSDPYILSGEVDMNDAALALFDQQGLQVWLQVEPGNADMLTLIDLVLNQYKNHPSVIGFGVDVEWYQSDGSPEGTPVSDAEAEAWVSAIRAVNPNYRLFLKHWETAYLPPAARDGIVFINDSQQFASLDELQAEFAAWGEHFAPAPVGFQYGYPADQPWWSKLQDPPAEIGQAILEATPNTTALFWVDFTVLQVFPVP
jgi:hypothetical protein